MNNHSPKLFGRWDRDTFVNTLLLILVCTIIFVVPVFPISTHKMLFNVLIMAIYLTAVMAIEKHRKLILSIAMASIIIEWIALPLNMDILVGLSNLINILFFIYVVISLIMQVARTKKVSARVIMESINGYLLLGVVFSLLIAMVMLLEPEAFSFPHVGSILDSKISYFGDYLYYGFVNYTTLGYGDIIPQMPFAKSLAILISVSGQIYVAVIIAMLVGKYVGGTSE